MTRERFAPVGGIDRDGIRLVTSGDGRARVTGTVIYLSTERAPSPSTERARGRRSGRMRLYVEALVGWLLIFGTAYLALLLTGE